MSRVRIARPALPAAAASLLLAACGSPIGKGVGPVSLGLGTAAGTTVTPQGITRVYECFTGAVTATLYFSDGSVGDFTGRVKWASSNPSVVRVSNGDIAVADGSGFYAAGTLVPVAPGNATVTAEFGGLTAQLPVSVGAPTSFTIKRTVQNRSLPVTALTLGAGTSQQFSVSAVVDGVSKDVSNFAKWTIDPNIASVTAGGLVVALGTGGPTPLTASFADCSNSVAADLSVAAITGLEIQPEFGSDALLLNNSERIDVFADLADGTKQDVSEQSHLTTTDSNVANFVAGLQGLNILQPVAVGAVGVQATLQNTYTAPDATVNIVQSTLNSFTVAPSSLVLRAGSDEIGYFTATGTYANGQVQDITRSVTWAVIDTTLATISNVKATAGLATPNASLVGQTTVTATPPTTDSAATTASATLTIDSTTNPATP